MKPPLDTQPHRAISRRAELVLALVATLVCAALIARTNFLIDDAFISFRYARHWNEWGLPAYNPGESPPVEGYSNLLWVLWLRLAARLGAAPELASRALSSAAGLACVWMTLRLLARRLELPLVPTAIGALALASMPPFTVWCTGGLETALFSCLLFAAFAGLTREGRAGGELASGDGTQPALASAARAPNELARGAGLGLVGVALLLTRPEGILWVLGLALLAWLLPDLVGGERAGERRRALAFLAVALLGFAGQLAWRRSVHGEWLPNTVRAKAGLSAAVLERGRDNLVTYLLLFVTPLVALLAWPCAGASRARRRAALASTAMLVGGCAYSLSVGGDWMPMFRFLAPLSPFVAIGLALVCARLGRLAGGLVGLAAVSVALLPAFDLSLAGRALLEPFYFRAFKRGYESEYERWRTSASNEDTFELIGRGLATLPGGPHSLTLGNIGAIGYYSDWTILDRNGLVDREVARLPVEVGEGTAGHDRRVPRSWFDARQPEFYEVKLYSGQLSGPEDPALRALAKSLGESVLRDGDAALLEHSRPFVYALPAGEGLPPNTSLVLLQRTQDANARAYWVELGLLRRE